ncbi:MAG TPA: hypothetical protein VGG70_05970 [Candidatus Cybelea sp.]
MRVVEGRLVRVGFRTMASLALCAAAAGAALAHLAIDVLGDYALTRDSYDYLRHGSRELVTGLALLVAVFLAARGLHVCCEIAARNRMRLVRPVLRLHEALVMLFGAVAASLAIVPAMEYLDGRLDGVPVRGLDEAFGGSIPLGIATTIAATGLFAVIVYAVARWLISHRDSIATIIEFLLRPFTATTRAAGYDRFGRHVTLRRRRAPNALRLAKRGPPATTFA